MFFLKNFKNCLNKKLGLPVFATPREAKEATQCDASVIYVFFWNQKTFGVQKLQKKSLSNNNLFVFFIVFGHLKGSSPRSRRRDHGSSRGWNRVYCVHYWGNPAAGHGTQSFSFFLFLEKVSQVQNNFIFPVYSGSRRWCSQDPNRLPFSWP